MHKKVTANIVQLILPAKSHLLLIGFQISQAIFNSFRFSFSSLLFCVRCDFSILSCARDPCR